MDASAFFDKIIILYQEGIRASFFSPFFHGNSVKFKVILRKMKILEYLCPLLGFFVYGIISAKKRRQGKKRKPFGCLQTKGLVFLT